MIFLLVLFNALLLGTSLQGQTCCTAGAPISTSLAINAIDSNMLVVQLEYSFNSVNRLVDDNEVLRNDPRSRTGQNLMLKIDYALNKKIAFSAILPYVNQARESFSQAEVSNGLGDLTLLAQYNFQTKPKTSISFLNKPMNNFGLALGIKVPTGKIFHDDDRGVVLSPDMQSGSGSYDFLIRTFHQKNHFVLKNLSLMNSASYKINTTNQHFGDPQKLAGRQFKFGNELILQTQLFYNLLLQTNFILPDVGLQLRISEANVEQGVLSSNSGGQWLSIPFGLAYFFKQKSTLRVFGELPIWQNLDGLQITSDYRFGIQFRHFLNL